MSPLGLYVHIPFCGSICSYCNFNRGLLDESLKDRYLLALQREIHLSAECFAAGVHPATGRPLSPAALRTSHGALSAIAPGATAEPRTFPVADTIYFGGGTPSLLSPDEIAALIGVCRSSFRVSDDAEVTLEANPETVTRETLAGYRGAGVTRVSLGVQSFLEEELRRLGRVHTAARARQAFATARAAGIDNLSLDLMLWLPGQTVEQCLSSVHELARLGPEHASLYLLELSPKSPLKEEMARAGWSQTPEDDAADMYLRAIDVLAEAGYEHYEISNFARPGRRSRHNLKYWTDGEWLAFGCGAHSTIDGVRWKNVSATDVYATALESGAPPPITERRELGAHQRFQEAMFMGLRLVEGIDADAIGRRYGIDVWERYGERLRPFVEAGVLLADREKGTLRLSARGLLVSNEVMTVFIDDTVR